MLSCLTAIETDETLYSWSSTNHMLSCQQSSEDTALALLYAKHAARQHEFPQSIDVFIRASEAEAELPTEILRRHSIAGFYLPFLSRQAQLDVATNGFQQKSQHWNRRLIGSSRAFKAVHPLKYCSSCINGDLNLMGRPYWHVPHQFPLTVFCNQHNQPLNICDIRSKRWTLPHQSKGFPLDLSQDITLAAQHVASVCATLPSIDSIDMSAVRQFALLRLQKMGVIHSISGVRHERLTRWFCSTGSYALARTVQPLLKPLVEASPISPLLWRQKRNTPILWIILWSALDWSSTYEAALTFASVASGTGPIDKEQLPLFPDGPPKSQEAPSHVRNAFLRSNSYAEVMTHLNVSRSDIVRWLNSDPNLRTTWKLQLREGRVAECTQRIKAFANLSPYCSLSDMERNCSAELRWLREHSPRIYADLLKSIPRRNPTQFQLFS